MPSIWYNLKASSIKMLVAKAPIYLANFAVDMRKSINGLSIITKEHFSSSFEDGAYYVFSNRNMNKVKILYWETNGYCLWYKRLESSRFKLSYNQMTQSITSAQLQWLLSGLDYQNMQGHRAKKYDILY